MSTHIDLKTQVSAIVNVRWEDFALEHPNLARVIDQHLVVEQAVSQLRLDAEYQHALSTAQVQGQSLEILVKIVDEYVVKWLKKLV